ncbi:MULTISPECIES: hypothetical protein [unclassified Marinobacter]|nr:MULTISPECIES: hypothetical protein [unclassified Marinobacter]
MMKPVYREKKLARKIQASVKNGQSTFTMARAHPGEGYAGFT